MNNHDLENLYRSTEEDMQFAIGLVALPDRKPAPIVQIRYRDWTREKLEVIVESYGWLFASPDFATAVEKRANEIVSRPASDGPNEADLKQRVEAINRQVDLLTSNVSPENLVMLDGKLTRLRKDKEELERKIADLQGARSGGQRRTPTMGAELESALRGGVNAIYEASSGLKRRLIRQLVERIELEPRKKTGTAWIWRLPKSVLDSLGLSVSCIAGAGLEPATSGL